MGVRSLAKRCLAVVAAVVVAYTPCANATPIMVVFDTTQLTGQSFILDLQLTGSATDSVAVTQFSPTPDGSMMNGFIGPGGMAPSGTSPSHVCVVAFQRMTHLRGLNGSPLRLTEARL